VNDGSTLTGIVYAASGSYATNAGSATSAATAVFATSSGYATNAGNAVFATDAGTAGTATSAGSAAIAAFATSSGYATNAGTATFYTETDSVVGSKNGIIKADGAGTISAAAAGTDYVAPNAAITGATKTKVTYDSKGLITAGADATLDDLGDVSITFPVLDQVLTYNGSAWVNSRPNLVSAGAGIDLFATTIESDVSTYYYLSRIPDSGAEVEFSAIANNNQVPIRQSVSPSSMDVSTLDAGIWVFHSWGHASAVGHSQLVYKIYSRTTGGTETLLFSVTSNDLGMLIGPVDTSTTQQSFALGATDRLVIKVYAQTSNTSDTTVYYYVGGTEHYSFVSTPLIVHHNELSGLQGGTSGQYYHLSSAQYAAAISAAATNGTYPGMGVGVATFATSSGYATNACRDNLFMRPVFMGTG
jgi:hypothetical protein